MASKRHKHVLIPLIFVTKGRHHLLSTTLGSLFSTLITSDADYSIHHVVQDVVNPYDNNYGLSQVKRLFESHNIPFHVYMMSGSSVAHGRAYVIQKLSEQMEPPEYVGMFDGDVIFVNNPIDSAYVEISKDSNVGAVGWSHVDFADDRSFSDYTHTAYVDGSAYLKEFGHLPYYDRPSPFHFYITTHDTTHLSTQGVWRVSALLESGALKQWLDWPVGVRSYDVAGCRIMRECGYTVRILSMYGGYTWHLQLKHDTVEGNWTSDAINVGKVT